MVFDHPNTLLFIPVSMGLSSVEKYLVSVLSNCKAFCSDDSFLKTIYATLNPLRIRQADGHWFKLDWIK